MTLLTNNVLNQISALLTQRLDRLEENVGFLYEKISKVEANGSLSQAMNAVGTRFEKAEQTLDIMIKRSTDISSKVEEMEEMLLSLENAIPSKPEHRGKGGLAPSSL